jgi:hypothetical protein
MMSRKDFRIIAEELRRARKAYPQSGPLKMQRKHWDIFHDTVHAVSLALGQCSPCFDAGKFHTAVYRD